MCCSLGFFIQPVFLLFGHIWSQLLWPSPLPSPHTSTTCSRSQRHIQVSLSSFSQNLHRLNFSGNRVQSNIYLGIKRRDLEVTRKFSLSLTPTWSQSPNRSSPFLMLLISDPSSPPLCSYIQPSLLTWVVHLSLYVSPTTTLVNYLCLAPTPSSSYI